jgi:hypothetical protein
MSKFSLSWFAMMIFAGLLTACGQNQDGQGGMGGDPGQQEPPPPSQPGSPPPP